MYVWILETTVVTTILAGLAFTACRIFKKTPALCHLIWLAVIVRFLLPPLPFESLTSTMTANAVAQFSAEPVVEKASDFDYVEEPIQVQFDSGVAIPVSYTGNHPAKTENETLTHGEPLSFEPEPALQPVSMGAEPMKPEALFKITVTWPLILGLIWFVGAVITLARQLVRVRRFREMTRLAEPAPAPLQAEIHEAATRMNMRTPRILMLPNIGAPFVWSFGKPTVFWPAWQPCLDQDQGNRSILIHELAHLKRSDHWVAWLELFALSLWWWNPVFHIARDRMRYYAELACDAWAVQIFPKERKAFAHALINAVERTTTPGFAVTAMGATGSDRRKFERRLSMIMKRGIVHKAPVWSAVIPALLLILLPGYTKPAELPEQPASLQNRGLERGLQDKVEAAFYANRGEAAFKAEDYQIAKTHFEKVVRLQPNSAKGYYYLGKCEIALENYAAAIKALETHEDLESDWWGGNAALAAAYAGAGDMDKAIQILNETIARGQGNSWNWYRHNFDGSHGKAMEKAAADPAFAKVIQKGIKLDRLDDEYDRAWKDEDWDRAYELAREMADLTPNSTWPLNRVGISALRAERFAEAEQAFRQILSIKPDSTNAHYNIACTYALRGQSGPAIDYLTKTIELGWDDYEHLVEDKDLNNLRDLPEFKALTQTLYKEYALGKDIRAAAKRDNYNEVLNLLDDADRLKTLSESDRRWITGKRAFAHYHLGQYEMAAQYFIDDAVAEDFSDIATPLYNAACSYALADLQDEAMRYLVAAVDAGFAKAHQIAGDSDFRNLRGNPEFQALVKRSGMEQLAHKLHVSTVSELHGKLEDMLHGQRSGPKDLYKIGTELYRSGIFDQAAEFYTKAGDAGRNPQVSYYNAACSHALAGNKTAAMEMLLTAVEEGYGDYRHMLRDSDLASLQDLDAFKTLIDSLRYR